VTVTESRKSDFTGDVYGDWLVVERAPSQGDRKRRWLTRNVATGEEALTLQCDLGNLGGDKALSGQITERVLAANAMVHLDGNPFNVYLGPDEDDELDIFQMLAETTPADIEDDDEDVLPLVSMVDAEDDDDSFLAALTEEMLRPISAGEETDPGTSQAPDRTKPFVLEKGHGLSIEEIGDKIYGPRPVVAMVEEIEIVGDGGLTVEPEAASLNLGEDLRSVVRSAMDAVLKAKVALNLATKTLDGLL
jgi:hypothetical protein